MNPYEATSEGSIESVRRSGIWQFVTAILFVLSAIIVATPGFLYLIFFGNTGILGGRRYATYGGELWVFGISITPTVAQILALVVAPLLLAISLFLVCRGFSVRRVRV